MTPTPDPDRVILPTPDQAERTVRIMAAASDQEYPADGFGTARAAAFLRACGYDCTLGALMRFVSRGYVSEPPNGLWTPMYLFGAACAMDSRRRWLPSPNPFHDAKKSAARLQIESAVAQGIETFVDLEQHSLEDLLLRLTQCDQRHLREVFYECVRAKMSDLGFVEE